MKTATEAKAIEKAIASEIINNSNLEVNNVDVRYDEDNRTDVVLLDLGFPKAAWMNKHLELDLVKILSANVDVMKTNTVSKYGAMFLVELV